jgi:cytochrome oxidase Cu insertion factor (SCO1/SenC/PrrC family)
VARVLDGSQQRRLLSAFGVVSLPDGLGGIKHNAAAHIVDARGRLVAILDEGERAAILRTVDRLLAGEANG